jgi:6-phosphogluconate dehydrogenase (decarboxylating)
MAMASMWFPVTSDLTTPTKRERHLNDKLRHEMPHGSVVIRGGAKQFSDDQLYALTQLIRDFDDFGFDSDADGLHDSGKLMFEGVEVVWQIDKGIDGFSAESSHHSNRVGIQRKLIIMLANDAN